MDIHGPELKEAHSLVPVSQLFYPPDNIQCFLMVFVGLKKKFIMIVLGLEEYFGWI